MDEKEVYLDDIFSNVLNNIVVVPQRNQISVLQEFCITVRSCVVNDKVRCSFAPATTFNEYNAMEEYHKSQITFLYSSIPR